MTELLRVRMVRAPQRSVPPGQLLVQSYKGFSDLLTAIEDSNDSPEKTAYEWIDDGNLLEEYPALQTPILQLDELLVIADNRLDPHQILKLFPNLPKPDTKVRSHVPQLPPYWQDRKALADSLVACLLTQQYPERALRFNRLLLICGLIELLHTRPAFLPDADAVYEALRWQVVVLPPTLSRPIDRLSRRPGFADLYVVRQEWAEYVPGEIAHIENVLKGEFKKRTHTREDETEITIFTESEDYRRDERDLQTTDRFELATEASRQSELAVHAEGSLDVQGPAGPTTIQAHIGGSVDFAQSSADMRAMTTSREVIDRAVNVIESRVREARTTRKLTRITELNDHSIDNVHDPEGHVVGIYRWVNKVYQCQLYRYPHRFLIELQIPEPGAWWRAMLAHGRTGLEAGAPKSFTTSGKPNGNVITAHDINELNCAIFAARWGVIGLPVLPPKTITIAEKLKFYDKGPGKDVEYIDREPIRFHSHETGITIPVDYAATKWSGHVKSWHNWRYANKNTGAVRVVVADVAHDVGISNRAAIDENMPVKNLGGVTGIIPISVMTDSVYGFVVHVLVDCERMQHVYKEWQVAVFDLLYQGYQAQQQAYEESLRAADLGNVLGDIGDNPTQGTLIIREELKKQIAQVLMDTKIGRSALSSYAMANGQQYPTIDRTEMTKLAPWISFFEQAFEWENLSWVMYPYYWSDREDWPTLAQIEGLGTEFSAFLRAGSARVIIPARPGFEAAVNFFLTTGWVWGGAQPPSVGDSWYLTIDAEIRAQQRAPEDGVVVGDPWDVTVPTELVWLAPDATLPKNPAIQRQKQQAGDPVETPASVESETPLQMLASETDDVVDDTPARRNTGTRNRKPAKEPVDAPVR